MFGFLQVYGMVLLLFPWMMCGIALIYFAVKVDVTLHLLLLAPFILLGLFPLFSFFIVPDFEFLRYHPDFWLWFRMVSRLMCMGFSVLNLRFKSRLFMFGYWVLIGVVLTDCLLSLLNGDYVGP